LKNVLAIIPARSGSKGIPNKNIKLLGGRPLIEYTFENCKSCNYIQRTIVTTDSNEIADISLNNGIEVPFLRPKNISNDESTSKSYVLHALEFLKKKENYIPEIILILQPTSPFRQVVDIKQTIDILNENDADSVVSVTEIDKKYNPEWQFNVMMDGSLKFFNKDIDWNSLASRRQKLASTYTRNGAVYCFKRKCLTKYKNIYGVKVFSYIMPRSRSINLDTLEDWLEAENYLKKQ
tara:strand:- start:409 stop:1116 length:708 start_codon:yes stop_codon:yes gene_type:complete